MYGQSVRLPLGRGLKEGRAYKLLGIYLDEHLTLNFHTKHLVSKLTRSLYCIKQAKHIIPATVMRALYFDLIHSHLVYCSSLLSMLSAKNVNKIKKYKIKMLRIMDGSWYNAHTAPVMLKYQILPYELLTKQSQLSFMHSIEYKYAPNSFDNVCKLRTPTRV